MGAAGVIFGGLKTEKDRKGIIRNNFNNETIETDQGSQVCGVLMCSLVS